MKLQTTEEYIFESSINRLLSHFKNYDAAILTAYRSSLTKEENKERNRQLYKALLSLDCSITQVEGRYTEEETGRNAKENSFVVVNMKNKPEFKKTIVKLGKHFEQDSVLFIRKGSPATAYLYGTRKNDSHPKMDEEIPVGKLTSKISGNFFTRIKNKKFVFENMNTEDWRTHCNECEYAPQNISSIERYKNQGKTLINGI